MTTQGLWHYLNQNSPFRNGTNSSINPFPKKHILDSSKLKHFADDNFEIDENVKVIQKGRKQCRKRRKSLEQAISPFPTVFSKELYCKHIETRACLGKRLLGESIVCLS